MSATSSASKIQIIIPADHQGQRLDKALAQLLPDYSRSRLQQWLEQGLLTVNGATPARKTTVQGGEHIDLNVPEQGEQDQVSPEPMPLDIMYEDEAILVLNKPAGLVMHPGAGNHSGTLQNGLLHYNPTLSVLPRAGIVHRLDKETSGAIIVAKTFLAHKNLAKAFAERTVLREYEAISCGSMTAGGKIEAEIGRHPVNRKKMAVRQQGRKAVTHYRVIQRFRAHTHVRCRLETGRTHQIRVHLAHIRYPIFADPTYGRRLSIPKGASEAFTTTLRSFNRQALHAKKLGLAHPLSGEPMQWETPYPEDFKQLLAELKTDQENHSG